MIKFFNTNLQLLYWTVVRHFSKNLFTMLVSINIIYCNNNKITVYILLIIYGKQGRSFYIIVNFNKTLSLVGCYYVYNR